MILPGLLNNSLETGATVQVPLFVDVGDTLRIDTRTGNIWSVFNINISSDEE